MYNPSIMIKWSIGKEGLIHLTLVSMREYPKDIDIQILGFKCLQNLVFGGTFWSLSISFTGIIVWNDNYNAYLAFSFSYMCSGI